MTASTFWLPCWNWIEIFDPNHFDDAWRISWLVGCNHEPGSPALLIAGETGAKSGCVTPWTKHQAGSTNWTSSPIFSGIPGLTFDGSEMEKYLRVELLPQCEPAHPENQYRSVLISVVREFEVPFRSRFFRLIR